MFNLGPVSFSFIPGVEKLKGEQVYSLNDYKGKFLVILFYQADWECQDMLISFSKMKNKFSSSGCELVACSTDNTKVRNNLELIFCMPFLKTHKLLILLSK